MGDGGHAGTMDGDGAGDGDDDGDGRWTTDGWPMWPMHARVTDDYAGDDDDDADDVTHGRR